MIGYLSIPVLAVIVLVQSTIVPEIRFAGGMPDLVLLMVLSISMIVGLEQGLLWAIVGGVLQDLISAVPVGTTALALVGAVTVVHVLFGQIGPRRVLYPLAAIIGATMVAHAVTLGVLLVVGYAVPLGQTLRYVTLPSLVYNMLVLLPIYRVVGAFYTAGRSRRVESFGG